MSAETPRPTLDILCGALAEIDERTINLERNLIDSAAITDSVLQELSLQIAFLMQTIRVNETQNGGLAGADGKVVSVQKTAAQVYVERGRAMMLKKREELQRAQGLSPATPPANTAADAQGDDATPKGNGAATDTIVGVAGPKLVTH